MKKNRDLKLIMSFILFIYCLSTIAQSSNTIKGLVVDDKNDPLPGVSVSIKGTTTGTLTDVDGQYVISGKDTDVLVLSFMGFKKQEIIIGQQKIINITMEEESIVFDDVIVVGYGIQKKSDVTGAISSVKSEQINKIPSTSVNEMLRGSAPGVEVTMGSAAPGGTSNLLIRGRRSLSGGNTPLYIVDGVPTSSIDDINANDIASIEVLKDAASQSIYGARAANGVILISTKRGISGKTSVEFSSYVGIQDINRNFEFYDGEQWAAYRKEAFFNAYGYYNEEEAFPGLMRNAYRSKKYVDWEDVMISTALQNKNDLLIRSGNDKTKYALSLGHYYQDGMVPSSGFQRFTGRLNVDQKLSKKVSIESNISYTHSVRDVAEGSFNSFITIPPLSSIYYDDGSLREDVTEAGQLDNNPLWNNQNSEYKDYTNRLNINIVGDWSISKEFSLRLNTSMSSRLTDENSYLGVKHTKGREEGGRATVKKSSNYNYLVEGILNYSKKINKHQIDGTLVGSLNTITWNAVSNTGGGFPNDDLGYHGIGSALNYSVPTYEYTHRKLVSYMMRGRYNYDSKYLLTVAMRVDGSSVFGTNNKYGYFPSIALAWRIKEEKFLQRADFLSDLKLRLSYGQVGNQGIDPYQTLGLASKYLYEFGEETATGYLPDEELTNPDLKWETSTTTNIGIDYGLWDNKISGTIELYNTETTDLLVKKSLSSTSGYRRQLVNLGRVQNKGIEFSINTTPIRKTDFVWNLGFNFAKNKNIIKKIDGRIDANGKPVNDLNNNWFIGESMNVYYDYQFDGIWQLDSDISNSSMPTATPGSIRVSDTNGDKVISVDDRIIIPRDPKFTSAIITSVEYKEFGLSADLYYRVGGFVYNPYLSSFENGGDLLGKKNGIRRNYWTIHNPSQEAPAPNLIQAPAYISSLAYEKADYFRIRNMSLSYNIPNKLLRKVGVERLKLYLSASNLYTYSKVRSYGPEQNPGAYPEPRTFLFGFNMAL